MKLFKRCTPAARDGSTGPRASSLDPRPGKWMKIRFGLGVLVERVIWLFCDVVDRLAAAVAAGALAVPADEKAEAEMEYERLGPNSFRCFRFQTGRDVYEAEIYHDVT
ncbi:MAG: hypothetical protein OXG56_11140 [Gammaproteobacteria bacterium]|nr:hypothetical protein [Gammaproteobacteria bacterium]